MAFFKQQNIFLTSQYLLQRCRCPRSEYDGARRPRLRPAHEGSSAQRVRPRILRGEAIVTPCSVNIFVFWFWTTIICRSYVLFCTCNDFAFADMSINALLLLSVSVSITPLLTDLQRPYFSEGTENIFYLCKYFLRFSKNIYLKEVGGHIPVTWWRGRVLATLISRTARCPPRSSWPSTPRPSPSLSGTVPTMICSKRWPVSRLLSN